MKDTVWVSATAKDCRVVTEETVASRVQTPLAKKTTVVPFIEQTNDDELSTLMTGEPDVALATGV